MSGAKVTLGDADGVRERGAFRTLRRQSPSGANDWGEHPGQALWQLKPAVQERNKMSLGVLNNIAAIYAENNLNQTQSSLQTTLTAVVVRIPDQQRGR